MKIINKVLYITTDNLVLHCHNKTITLTLNEEEKLRIPISLLEEIVIFGNTMISNYVIKECNENNVIISYVSVYGNFCGRFYGKTNGNILLRKKQYEIYDNMEKRTEIVKNIILGKFINSKNVLIRVSRDCNDSNKKNNLIEAANKINSHISLLKNMNNIDSIRGLEGAVATIYFNVFDYMLKIEDDNMLFKKRSKRPPQNNCNAILSLLYTLLTLNINSALETFGLDSSLGYMHTLKPGRASLSLDLIEELRAPIVDKFIITLINRKQLTSNDFENGIEGIRLKDNSLKRILKLWEEHKDTEIIHPLYNEKTKIKIIPYLQAQLLAQHIRGDIPQYPPFKWR